MLTENTGQVEIDVPRDRAGTFEPQIVRKRQRRLNGVDEVVLSLYAKGGGWNGWSGPPEIRLGVAENPPFSYKLSGHDLARHR